MVTISVLYPRTAESRFDHDYYMQKHVPMVRARLKDMGFVKLELMRGLSTLDGGPPPFELIAHLTFSSPEHMQAALVSAGVEIMGDIPNYSNVQPLIQLNWPAEG